MSRRSLALAGLLISLPLPAAADPLDADVMPTQSEEPPAPRPNWLRRWAPTNNYVELGLHGGFLRLDRRHELYDSGKEWQPLTAMTAEFGARIGYYPLRFVGAEVEGGVLPGHLRDSGEPALIYAVRGHVVAQLGLWALTPFVLVGGGLIGIRSDPSLLGRDVDPALDFGGGLKLHLADRWVVRLDVRDVVANRRGVDVAFGSHNLELLLGVAVRLGLKPKPKPDPNRATEPESDPEPIGDRDGDGFYDDRDACIDVAGVAPSGCPIPDSDGDGLLDPDDGCVDQPETRNGFEDADGCPDQLPDAVAKFNGKISGITFETGKATIRRSSLPVLDEAVRVLVEHSSVRIEISGHTDDTGTPERNLELSKQRADSVASYLEGMGVAADRMTTLGLGQSVPIESNETKAGRANNRRIEFRILTE